MKKWIAVITITLAATLAGCQSQNAQLDQCQQENAELKAKVEDMEGKLIESWETITSLTNMISSMEGQPEQSE